MACGDEITTYIALFLEKIKKETIKFLLRSQRKFTCFVLVNNLGIQKKKCKSEVIKMLRSVDDNAVNLRPIIFSFVLLTIAKQ